MGAEFEHIKAVLCDVDGTLLTSGQVVSPRTVAAIKALRGRGVLFGLCTGRDAKAAQNLLGAWGIDGLVDIIVGFGGAEVVDFPLGVDELSYPLEPDAIGEIIDRFEGVPASPVCPFEGVIWAFDDNRLVRELSRTDVVPYRVVDRGEFLRRPLPKVMFTCDARDMPAVIERARSWNDPRYTSSALQTTKTLFEFTDPRVSKTRGLTRVAELNGITLADICVFGDADNDACMVADAGVGVAMANGSEATRGAADYVTASNDEDGIAVFIEGHLL